MRFQISTAALAVTAGLFAMVNGHFVLQIPTSLGFDDEALTEAPCGGFDPAVRTNQTLFPVKGSAVAVLTTHDEAVWEYNVALASDLNTWIPLTNWLNQEGLGDFCEPQIPGRKTWAGKKAVLQVVQQGHNSKLYQCAAIKFVRGGPAATPAGCVNDTSITASWII